MDCSEQYALIVFPLHLIAASNCKNTSFVILIHIVEFHNRLQRYSFFRNSTICTLMDGYYFPMAAFVGTMMDEFALFLQFLKLPLHTIGRNTTKFCQFCSADSWFPSYCIQYFLGSFYRFLGSFCPFLGSFLFKRCHESADFCLEVPVMKTKHDSREDGFVCKGSAFFLNCANKMQEKCKFFSFEHAQLSRSSGAQRKKELHE